jgi:PQ loop repeat
VKYRRDGFSAPECAGAATRGVCVCVQVFVGVAMSVGARIPQIVLNMQRGNTGELAMLSFALSTAGNLIRCYTTVILTSDLLLLATTAAQALLNGIITVQCFQTEMERRKLVVAGAT